MKPRLRSRLHTQDSGLRTWLIRNCTVPAQILPIILATTGFPAFGADANQVQLIHNHHLVPGMGMMDITKGGVAWHEAAVLSFGNPAHSFSVPCSAIKQVGPPGLLNSSRVMDLSDFKLVTSSKTYLFTMLSQGRAAALVVDQIRLNCRLGSPLLSSSRECFGNERPPEDEQENKGVAEEVSYDARGTRGLDRVGLMLLKNRGVVFISRNGLRYEEIGDNAVAQARSFSLDCGSLTDVTINREGGIDIRSASEKYRILVAPAVSPGALKQAIANFCPHN